MDNTIDTLKIEITGEDKSASSSLDALLSKLENIKKTIATIGTSAVITDVNWLVVASASLLAGFLSLLTSVAGLPEVEE